jgi:uncharacterized protein YkwD
MSAKSKLVAIGSVMLLAALIFGCSYRGAVEKGNEASPVFIALDLAGFEGVRLYGLESISKRDGVDFFVDKVEAVLVEMINKERKEAGIAPLNHDFRIKEVARNHSNEMKTMAYFSHNSPVPENRTLAERLSKAAVNYWVAGENIAVYPKGADYRELASELMDKYMNSATHRNNILNPSFTSVGVGVASDSKIFVTLDFIGESAL